MTASVKCIDTPIPFDIMMANVNVSAVGAWYRKQRAQGVRPVVAGTIPAVAEQEGKDLCPACNHPAHPGQVCAVDVDDEPCGCDCGVEAGVQYDNEDQPYQP